VDQVIVRELLNRVEALTRQVEEQRAEIDGLKADVYRSEGALGEPDNRGEAGTSRRNLLLAGAGMAAAVVVGKTEPAHADFRATLIADAGNAYGGLGAPGGDPGAVLPALGATTHGLIGVAEAGSRAPALKSGVLGTGKASAGVQALSVSGFGLYARSTSGAAVFGTSVSKHGVRGECVTAAGAVDKVAVPLAGVLGISNKAYGVAGVAAGAVGAGVAAFSHNAKVPALLASAATSSGFAAMIAGAATVNGDLKVTGNVSVNGDFVAIGQKSAALPHADGTHRLVYCVEAPEAWLEDFGEASVTDGKGEVALDPDFAGLCESGSFHVFIAGHCDFPLRVSARGSTGFTVEADREIAALKGLAPADLAGTFSYRVVGRRKDKPGVRLQPFVLPKMEVEVAEPG
jgi:hypothetical protein